MSTPPEHAGERPIWARRMREARKAANLTQVALAALLDVSQSTITDWETGKLRRPRGQMARAIAKAIKYDIANDSADDDQPFSAGTKAGIPFLFERSQHAEKRAEGYSIPLLDMPPSRQFQALFERILDLYLDLQIKFHPSDIAGTAYIMWERARIRSTPNELEKDLEDALFDLREILLKRKEAAEGSTPEDKPKIP